MNNIDNFNSVIEYIEENLTEDIDISAMAKKAKMSIYEFRRVFSFVAGIPISEYIRKRRLSRAASELIKKKLSVTDIAIKYGYDSASSFSRAFKEFQGFPPNEISKNRIKMFTKIGFKFCIRGGEYIPYSIVSRPPFYICGITETSDINDTVCCENVWNSFYKSDFSKNTDKSIYAAYVNSGSCVKCTIGNACNHKCKNSLYIPKSDWVCFLMQSSDNSEINKFYSGILLNWFNSAGYTRNFNIPNIEIFPAGEENDDCKWEICIPLN